MRRTPPPSVPQESRANTAPRLGIEEIAKPSLLDDERGQRVSLPNDHPEWRPDLLSLSNRAKALLDRIKPFVIRVITFWDHRTTSLPLDEMNIEVDASGSYRAT